MWVWFCNQLQLVQYHCSSLFSIIWATLLAVSSCFSSLYRNPASLNASSNDLGGAFCSCIESCWPDARQIAPRKTKQKITVVEVMMTSVRYACYRCWYDFHSRGVFCSRLACSRLFYSAALSKVCIIKHLQIINM